MIEAIGHARVRVSEMLTAKLLSVLLARVLDFVPDGLRTHPDVVDDPERVTSIGNGACWHEHSGWVVEEARQELANLVLQGLRLSRARRERCWP